MSDHTVGALEEVLATGARAALEVVLFLDS